MVDQKSHNPPTPKSDLSHPVGVGSTNAHEKLPPSSVNSADNATTALGVTATPSVSTLIDIYDSEAVDPVYQAKSHAISCAIQELGMGRYQVCIPRRVCEHVPLRRVRGSVSSGGCLSLLVLGGSGTPFADSCYRIQALTNFRSVPTVIAYGLYVQVGPRFIAPVDGGF